jgi:putative transposase
MTNHVHLLVTPATEDSIPRLMQALGRCYVRYVNKAYGRTGTLWEGRYKACLIQSDSYLLACQRYVELNPVRGGLVAEPGDYAHSSYRHNALGHSDPLVTEHATYTALGNSPAEYRRAYRRLFAADAGPDPTDHIREVTTACLVLGNDRFKDQIEAVLARSVRPGTAGRPRKIPV